MDEPVIGEGTPEDPCKVGCINSSNAKIVRVVHISDTHMFHDDYLNKIPAGDILIHTGDFGRYSMWRYFKTDQDFQDEMRELDALYAKLAHKHKIFVAGNHEMNFSQHTQDHIQSLFPNGIYLQDSACTVAGIKVYGSPWNSKRFSSLARGFSVPSNKLPKYWKQIPNDVDIVATHNPPMSILDLGQAKFDIFGKTSQTCVTCGQVHRGQLHWGCPDLLDTLLRKVRPKAHLFGHVHERNGAVVQDGILFSNAALKLILQPRVIDFYMNPETIS